MTVYGAVDEPTALLPACLMAGIHSASTIFASMWKQQKMGEDIVCNVETSLPEYSN